MTIEDDKFDIMCQMLDEFRKISNNIEGMGSAISDIEMQLQDLVMEIRDGIRIYSQ